MIKLLSFKAPFNSSYGSLFCSIPTPSPSPILAYPIVYWIAQVDLDSQPHTRLEPVILLPQPSKLWKCKHVSNTLALPCSMLIGTLLVAKVTHPLRHIGINLLYYRNGHWFDKRNHRWMGTK